MKGAVLFAAGIVVGAVLVRSGIAQPPPVLGLNHVGIAVADYDAALAFYTDTMGFREAYTIRNPDGSVRLTYLQLSRTTFVELIPAGAGQPTGITHFGIEVGDIGTAVAGLRANGIAAPDASLTPARAEFTRIADRDGVQIEVMELGPESLQRKAIDGWK
jgi:catechol 2,3-dioxygenase-like lactoylglutathione lyase family enzyme